MKKLYHLTMAWISEKESQGLSHEEAHKQVEMIAGYLDYVWKNKEGKTTQEP